MISTKPVKPVHYARTFHVILGAMTQNILLGLGGMHFSQVEAAQARNDLLSVFKIRSSFHDIFPRRLLVLGYSSGLQIWDCTNLDSIAEILNVTSPEWGRTLQAEVLPNPPALGDELLNSRPLLGIMYVDFILPLLY